MAKARRYAILREKKQDVIDWLKEVFISNKSISFMETCDFKQYSTNKWYIWEDWAGISITIYKNADAIIFELAWLNNGANFLEYI